MNALSRSTPNCPASRQRSHVAPLQAVPRSWSHIIDAAVQAALNTDEPTAGVPARAQAKAVGLNLAE